MYRLHMKTLNMQQLCSFAQDSQKIDERLVIIKTSDVSLLQNYKVIGCRILLLVFSGELDVETNGRPRTLQRCDFLDILEGTSFGIGACSTDLDFYCIITSRKFLLEALQNIVPGPKDYFTMLMANPVQHLSANGTARVFKQIRLMDEALSDINHTYRTEMVRTYFKSFVLELGDLIIKEKHLPGYSQQNMVVKDTLMANFMELVWKHFRERREVSFYAKELCVSTKHLARVVKSCTGKTPHEIISGEVLGLAIQLLKNEEVLIQEISDALHFADQAAFSKFFKKYLKVSPSQFRKNT